MQPTRNIGQLNAIALNLINDQFPGGGDASPGHVPGQLGARFALTNAQALALSDTTIGTLYGGIYQYVKFKAAPTTSAIKGLAVVWSDQDAYEVTVDVAADIDNALLAGIVLNTVTDGYYGFIQVAGIATVKVKASTTKGTPVIGDSVCAPLNADNGLCDVLADSTAVTFGTAATKMGRVFGRLQVAVATQLGVVQLINLPENI